MLTAPKSILTFVGSLRVAAARHGYSFNRTFKGLQEVPDPIAIRLSSSW